MRANKVFFKNLKILPVDRFFKNVLYDKKIGYYSSQIPFGEKDSSGLGSDQAECENGCNEEG